MIIIKIKDEYNEFGSEQENLIFQILEQLGFEIESLEVSND